MSTAEADQYREYAEECLRWVMTSRQIVYVVALSAVVGALAGALIGTIALWLTR